jgi:hypothetical protein
MKKIFATSWQEIRFDFCKLSKNELAGPDFYNSFYKKIFEKYSSYEQLPETWRRTKSEIADWLAQRASGYSTVLSIGCGLGYIEQRIHNLHGKRIVLHVQDYASDALIWLRSILPVSQIHTLNDDLTESFDMIYLSAVDYAMTDQELVGLLIRLKIRLKPEGKIILTSASFLDYKSLDGGLRAIKEVTKTVLHYVRLRNRGQLWGWMRTRKEYQRLINAAGFVHVDDGFLITSYQKTYWIEGRVS